ncbi:MULTISPECIES: SDR family oxidoreductase [unclassified Pusillimonas]|uniref:SDR family oxidoreductase n=1 Tax=unclassified Pusillimonas TaxID=2640016 RepID=UPI000B9C9968|nr:MULTISPECIES: SDR family oxidoreductase [unclassified Pusillimonas]OXR49079.1 short-chain dehydrogenase [Pusillimonas sp. T2]ROT45960.1 short-chain dehydrogenase [Pusillimonas sp. NJUB218]
MQRVFITGASSGIGAALARFYAARGCQLGLVGRRADALETLADALPGVHKVYVLDVIDRDALHRAANDFLSLGPVDVVIASAGISVGTLTEEAEDFDVFQRVMTTNVAGTVSTFEPFVAAMKAQGRGTLVGVASVAAVRGLPGAGAYSASKAAVRNYCESLRVELYGTGVKVVTLAPGFIRTPMTAKNPYKMPFLMPVDAFARRAIRAIDNGVSYIVIPWQMGWVARLLRWVPNSLYDRVASRRERKPRQTSQP